jgi:hypothetical protein
MNWLIVVPLFVMDPLLGIARFVIWFAKIAVFIGLSAYLAVLVLDIFEREQPRLVGA